MEGLRSLLSLQGIPGPSGPPGTKGLPGEPVSALPLPLCIFVLAGWSQIGCSPRAMGQGGSRKERGWRATVLGLMGQAVEGAASPGRGALELQVESKCSCPPASVFWPVKWE